MHPILDSAHAWFFDSLSHELNGSLVIHLVEGVKGSSREFVDVGEKKLGPYFPVRVEAQSRCVQVTFENALAFLAFNESYDTADPELKKNEGRFLFAAEASSFRRFTEARTSVAQLCQEPYQEFLLCCEDRVFHVLSPAVPSVAVLPESANLTVERTTTWSAS